MLRLAIILGSIVVIGVIGGLASIPLIIREPLAVVSPRSPAAFRFPDGEVTTSARLEVDAARRFVLVLTTGSETGAEVPTLTLRMLDHDMPPVAPDVQALSQNRFRASGSFFMPGRWQVSVGQGGKQQSFQFIVGQ